MTKEQFISLVSNRYDELQALNKIDNFYDYEKGFEDIWKGLGKEVLEKNISGLPADRRKKNLTTYGHISINNKHTFCKGNNGFQISPRMQELMVYAGHLDSYQKCNEVIKQFTQVDVSAAQVYRVTDTYVQAVGKTDVAERTMPPVKQEETLYAELDGSMIFTREEGWKEVKVGRIFKSGDCIRIDEKPGCIRHSQYVAHLGSCQTFTAQMDGLIEAYGKLADRLVFITDGAVWIRNWIADAFPQAVSILDYYHAIEHLYAFIENYFKDKEAGIRWGKEQKALLLESKVSKVIENVQKLAGNNKEAQKLIDYYSSNQSRMDYKRYKQIGCGIIGSGAIESAHRTVVQKRMKLSGQRWSKEGAQNMLHLRVASMNGQWNKIIQLTKTDFKAAA